jgi:hypothetical protein
MFVKIRIPTTVTGLGRLAVNQIIALTGREAMPLIVAGIASPRSIPTPEDDDEEQAFKQRKQRAREAGLNPDWDQQPPYAGMRLVASINGWSATSDFAESLCQAVQRRLTSRSHCPNTVSSSDDESFGQKLARAAKAQAASRSRCYKTPRYCYPHCEGASAQNAE